MEGEVRRLKIELDVYTQTVTELRKKLDAASKVPPENNNAKDKGSNKCELQRASSKMAGHIEKRV